MNLFKALKNVNPNVCIDVVKCMMELDYDSAVDYLNTVSDGLTRNECLCCYVSYCTAINHEIDKEFAVRWVES